MTWRFVKEPWRNHNRDARSSTMNAISRGGKISRKSAARECTTIINHISTKAAIPSTETISSCHDSSCSSTAFIPRSIFKRFIFYSWTIAAKAKTDKRPQTFAGKFIMHWRVRWKFKEICYKLQLAGICWNAWKTELGNLGDISSFVIWRFND